MGSTAEQENCFTSLSFFPSFYIVIKDHSVPLPQQWAGFADTEAVLNIVQSIILFLSLLSASTISQASQSKRSVPLKGCLASNQNSLDITGDLYKFYSGLSTLTTGIRAVNFWASVMGLGLAVKSPQSHLFSSRSSFFSFLVPVIWPACKTHTLNFLLVSYNSSVMKLKIYFHESLDWICLKVWGL